MSLDMTIIIFTLHQQLEQLLDGPESPDQQGQGLITTEITANSEQIITAGENNL